jgi:hypothetical protein
MKNLNRNTLMLFFAGVIFFLQLGALAQQNVGIGTTTPNSSALLDLTATNKGLLIPRMTTAQRIAIVIPATGLLVYDTNFNQFWYFDGTQWVQAIGPMGPTGPTGLQGLQGIQGTTGIQGVQGLVGPTGSQGLQGVTGPTGSQGVQGLTGPSGADGANGAVGAQGPTGPSGANGAAGVQGPTGLQGVTGPSGSNGAAGVQGPTGPSGTNGTVGAQGPTGPSGTNGAVGAQGPTGIQGATGPAGPVGCGSSNYVIKSNGAAATCSQIFDDGTNVGVGLPSTPAVTKLHVFQSGAVADLRLMSDGHDNAFAGGRVSFWSTGMAGYEAGSYSCINTGFGEFRTNISQGYFGNALSIYGLGSFANRYSNLSVGTTLFVSDVENGTVINKVGIGTITPQNSLDISNANGLGVAIGSYAGVNAASSGGLIISGNVGVGTSAPGAANKVDVFYTPPTGSYSKGINVDVVGNSSWPVIDYGVFSNVNRTSDIGRSMAVWGAATTVTNGNGRNWGVVGYASNGGANVGVKGYVSTTGVNNTGVLGVVSGFNAGFDESFTGGPWAGYFSGNIAIEGALQANGTVGTAGQVLTSNGAGAAYWGAAGSASTWTVSSDIAYSRDDIAGWTTVLPTGTDDATAVANLNFTFTINGTAYTQVTLSSNGNIQFGGAGTSVLGNGILPNAAFSTPTVCFYWDDMITDGNGVRYITLGAAGNRVFIADYEFHTFTGSYPVKCQIQLHEGSNSINIRYYQNDPLACGQGATIGLQVNGTTAIPISSDTKVLDDNGNPQSISFSP